jgi:hypothetical protein
MRITDKFISEFQDSLNLRKNVSKEIAKNKLDLFFKSINALNALSPDAKSVIVNDVIYALTDYYISDAFKPLIHDRFIGLDTNYVCTNLYLVEKDEDDVIKLNPREFKDIQTALYGMFKKTPSFSSNFEDISGASTLGEVMELINVGDRYIPGTSGRIDYLPYSLIWNEYYSDSKATVGLNEMTIGLVSSILDNMSGYNNKPSEVIVGDSDQVE